MYVFPAKTLNVLVKFTIGDEPASPELAAYIVRDMNGEVVSSTLIDVADDATEAWISIPATAHTLTPGEKYRQHRIDISYDVANMVFEKQIAYYVVPDLFISQTPSEVRQILGATEHEIPDQEIDFYRSYIDLSSGKYGDDFQRALNGTDIDLAYAAKQLIFWHTLMGLFSIVRMRYYKTVESETSKITRLGTATTLDPLEKLINSRYDYFLAMIYTATSSVPSIFIVSTSTDAITGV